jgi:hypothetical protein
MKTLRQEFTISEAEKQYLWGPIYESVDSIIGDNGIIVPMGDTKHENVGVTTVTTHGDIAALFTYSVARTSFATSTYFLGRNQIPIITFNGINEDLQSPDAAFWTRDDTAGQGFSMGCWINTSDADGGLLYKAHHVSTSFGEWGFGFSSGALVCNLRDVSANVAVRQAAGGANILNNIWHHLVVTYDGTGGATAANGMRLYSDGVYLGNNPINNAAYVGMENTTAIIRVGNVSVATFSYYEGQMAGGPLAPFWTFKNLSENEVKRLYEIGRDSLSL